MLTVKDIKKLLEEFEDDENVFFEDSADGIVAVERVVQADACAGYDEEDYCADYESDNPVFVATPEE